MKRRARSSPKLAEAVTTVRPGRDPVTVPKRSRDAINGAAPEQDLLLQIVRSLVHSDGDKKSLRLRICIIQRRLQLAGANCNSTVLFPADTIVRIHRHSRGIPRLINTVCENALITAYARQTRSVTPDFIEDIAADLRLGVVHQPNRKAERILADKHFQLILTLERQRSERSRKPFLLMLLDMGDRTPSEKNGKLLEKILAALSGSTRA